MARSDYRRLGLPAAATVVTLVLNSLARRVSGFGGAAGDALLSAAHDASGVAAWLAAAWLAARAIDLLLRRAAAARPRPAPYPRLLSDLLYGALFIVAAIGILLFVFDQTATGLIATSSVLIAVIGFALRYVISDVFSGIALNFDHPYRIGDWVEAAPAVVGKVVEITWRTTRLVTRDGISVVIPNGLIATGRLMNYSYPTPSFRTAIRLSLDAGLPVGRAKQILLAGALAATRTFPDLRPDVLAQDCTEAGVAYAVRFWVPDYELENACRDAVAFGVLEALRRAGLEPAPPKRELVTPPPEEGRPRQGPAEALLADIALFSAFSPDERAVLATCLVERSVRQGATVVRQGDPGGSLFFVREGTLDARIRDGAGAEADVNRIAAGEVFGEMSLLTGEARNASVVALTDAVLYELKKEDLAPLLERRPDLAAALAELMAARVAANRSRLAALDSRSDLETRPTPGGILRRLRSFFALPDAG